jgi:hypothetical protein
VRRVLPALLACLGALLLVPAAASAKVRVVWIAAVPTKLNQTPNGRDLITGRNFPVSHTLFPTIIYRRTTPGWHRPLRNSPRENVGPDEVPGPLIRARVGRQDRRALQEPRLPLPALALDALPRRALPALV